MSRTVNLNATLQEVAACCDRRTITISTIEPLDSGGTRVVLKNLDGAQKLRRHMKRSVIEGPVVRSGIYLARPPIPYD